ncbi:6-phospho-3-hexuloisomerase [Paenibacillus tarimensis]|uniref:6-phospho-3-hexuloisomerase n=1 Tax=Paenibacillus tarimensis TaxID=416012 RepID=UPI001F2842A5|nr:6-phospho-3-hexuloisomerase [Paenibacillus tarimensis]MCF2943024.1 6-phospho-3-hexuloisomerase [Paenibacillus tarimensis]
MGAHVDYAAEILRELMHSAEQLSMEEAEGLSEAILGAGKVFLAGAGRSGLMGRAFAMRLMHMDIAAYVVGETVTPGIGKGDLLIIGSGSGETLSLAAMARKASGAGAKVAAVTIHPASTIGQLADLTVKLPGNSKEQSERSGGTVQPMASLFEQTLLIFYDSLILRMMNKRGWSSEQMYGNHANLE